MRQKWNSTQNTTFILVFVSNKFGQHAHTQSNLYAFYKETQEKKTFVGLSTNSKIPVKFQQRKSEYAN